MTASFDPTPDADDRPATMGTALVPYRARRPSRAGRVFRWWLGLSICVFFVCALCLVLGMHNLDFAPMRIVIDGDDLSNGITINGLSDGAGAMLAVGGVLLALLLLLLIPVLLLLVLGSVAIALVCGIGVPLLALALVLGVVTSPFWVVGLIVWLLARRRDSPSLPPSATMAA